MWLGEIFIGWFLQKVSLCIGWPNNSCKIIVHWIARWQLLFLNWGHRKNLSWNCWAEINQLPIQKSERIYCPRREQASQICAGFSLRLEFEIGLFNLKLPQIYKSVLMIPSMHKRKLFSLAYSFFFFCSCIRNNTLLNFGGLYLSFC